MTSNTDIRRRTPGIFISWLPFHGRSDGLARELGIPGWFSDGGRGPAAIKDLRRWRQTSRLLRTERPEVVFVMQPPAIAMWCVWWYARKAQARIAGDLHTGVFTEPGTRRLLRHSLRLLSRHGIAVVTNDALKDIAQDHGCPTLVLHDLIEVCERDVTPPDNPVLAGLVDSPFVLVPLAYGYDEPIDELLEAARSTPDLRWVFTGRAGRKVKAAAPANISFPGFVSNEDFFRAMSQAAVIVAMTKYEHTMQRAAYEAMNFGRPLVTADTEVLRTYYSDAAHIVAPQSAAIADGVRRALLDDDAAQRMIDLRARRIGEQEQALDRLRAWVAASGARLPD